MRSIVLRNGSTIFTVLAILVLTLLWRFASAQEPTPVPGNPAQIQLWQIMVALNDSEAEYALGSYIPGTGAVINMHLIRGPNTIPGKTSYKGTRDWVTELMRIFGPQLTAVPSNETIAFSVEFFDYPDRVWHQIVVTSRAADVGDVDKYQIWLNGRPYVEVAGELNASRGLASTIAPPSSAGALASEPPASIMAPPSVDTSVPVRTAVAPEATAIASIPARPQNVTFDFSDPRAAEESWQPISGQWVFEDGGYAQTRLDLFDLISVFNEPVAGAFTLQAELRHVDGEMGGGLIFGAPTNTSKAGAHMLAIEVSHDRYRITLGGALVADNIPVVGSPEGYVGLTTSTSHVIFDNVKIESR